jgi:hypothetical protein
MQRAAEADVALPKGTEACRTIQRAAERGDEPPKDTKTCRTIRRATEAYDALPKDTTDCRRIRRPAEGYDRLPKRTALCRTMRQTAEGYDGLPMLILRARQRSHDGRPRAYQRLCGQFASGGQFAPRGKRSERRVEWVSFNPWHPGGASPRPLWSTAGTRGELM